MSKSVQILISSEIDIFYALAKRTRKSKNALYLRFLWTTLLRGLALTYSHAR